jgi:hypothetical protein
MQLPSRWTRFEHWKHELSSACGAVIKGITYLSSQLAQFQVLVGNELRELLVVEKTIVRMGFHIGRKILQLEDSRRNFSTVGTGEATGSRTSAFLRKSPRILLTINLDAEELGVRVCGTLS